MRKLLLFSALALVYWTSLVVAQPPQPAPVATEAIAPGSIVEVAMEGVQLKSGKSVVAVLPKGVRFEVLSVRDPWLEGGIVVNGVLKGGWVLRSQVALVPAEAEPAAAANSKTPQITGVLGSPSATTTISGMQLPAPQPKFGGVIKDDALQSKQWWAPRIVPPKDAPNVLLILTDDAGFGVPSTFGGVIPTPTMDRIAKNGLRYNRIFSTSLCSPTRAALITGRNHHSVGFGVIAEQATGFPGYNSVIGADNATIGRILRDNGYATSWFGKDHNTPTYEASQAGPFTQWPTGMGFDYFYGFVGGDANQWGPNLFRNTTQIYPWIGHEGTLKMDRSDPKAAIWPVTGKESAGI